MRGPSAALVFALWPGVAAAAPGSFPARAGESGLLDVPEAEVLRAGDGQFGLELRSDGGASTAGFGPSPLALAIGLGAGFETGFALRQGGVPGDPRPSPLLASAVAKYEVLAARGRLPNLAVGGILDRINLTPSGTLRLIASADAGARARWSVVGGFDPRTLAPEGGGAVLVSLVGPLALVADGLYRRAGTTAGVHVRYALAETVAIGAGADWLSGGEGFRAGVSLALSQRSPRKVERLPEPIPAQVAQDAPRRREFLCERPCFRQKIKVVSIDGGRHLQYGPPPPAPPPAAPAPPPPPPPVVPIREGRIDVLDRLEVARVPAPPRPATTKAAIAQVDALHALCLRAVALRLELVVAVGVSGGAPGEAARQALSVHRAIVALNLLPPSAVIVEVGPRAPRAGAVEVIAIGAPRPRTAPAREAPIRLHLPEVVASPEREALPRRRVIDAVSLRAGAGAPTPAERRALEAFMTGVVRDRMQVLVWASAPLDERGLVGGLARARKVADTIRHLGALAPGRVTTRVSARVWQVPSPEILVIALGGQEGKP